MKYCDIGSATMAYDLFGKGDTTLVIDSCLGSCSAEWRHIAEDWGHEFKVLIYDRAGYGTSSSSMLERTPQNIAGELHQLIESIGLDGDSILLGHSQGGLYAVQYAILYPERVKGLLLLDPATPFDSEFKSRLTPEEYQISGVDKTKMNESALKMLSLHLGWVFKLLMKGMPPFKYYTFQPEAKSYLLSALCSKSTYATSIAEYLSAQNQDNTRDIVKAIEDTALGSLPVRAITHSGEVLIREYYTQRQLEKAQKIEDIWQEIMKRYLCLSNNATHQIAPNSGHYIHLTDTEVVKKAVENLYALNKAEI